MGELVVLARGGKRPRQHRARSNLRAEEVSARGGKRLRSPWMRVRLRRSRGARVIRGTEYGGARVLKEIVVGVRGL